MNIRGVGEIEPVVPAPMSGYGDRAWREIVRRVGCDLVIVPMISAEGLVRGDKKTSSLVDIEGERPPVVVQLFGTRSESLAEAARKVVDFGAAGVDLNLGCPARRVVSGGGGAAVLKHPDLVGRLVGALRKAVSTATLTVKMRACWDECCAGPAQLARIVEAEGADAISLHARTGRQQFHGSAHWPWIGEAKAAVGIPVIGNGDVKSGQDAVRMQRETGCDGVMIGRAAVGRPWLLRQAIAWLAAGGRPCRGCAEPSWDEQLDWLVEHARLMARFRGEPHGVVEFRKHAVCYVKGLPRAKLLKQALMECTGLAEIESVVEAYRRRDKRFAPSGPAETG